MGNGGFGMNMTRRAALAAFAGVAGSAALALGGCGAASQGSQGSQGKKTVRFVLDYTPNTNHTGIYVALARGFYAEAGLDVQILQPPEDGADALIGSGGADLGVTYQDYIANSLASASPLPYTAVAAVVQHNTSGIMSRAEDGITHPAAMAGHTYATWNMPVEQATVRDVVTRDGGRFEDVRLVPYDVDDEVAGLRAHMFDTVWVYEAWAVQNAAVQGMSVNYFPFTGINAAFDYYTPVIAVNDSFAAANPDVVRAFLKATRRGYELAVSSPSEAAECLLTAVPELSRDLVMKSQEFLATRYVDDAPVWGWIDSARWSAFYTWLNENGLVANPIDPSAGFTCEYLEQALRSCGQRA